MSNFLKRYDSLPPEIVHHIRSFLDPTVSSYLTVPFEEAVIRGWDGVPQKVTIPCYSPLPILRKRIQLQILRKDPVFQDWLGWDDHPDPRGGLGKRRSADFRNI